LAGSLFTPSTANKQSRPRLASSEAPAADQPPDDLDGIVAKRLADPYAAGVRWLKIKNPDYTQQEGRSDLFNRSPRPLR